ncbi:MAG: hypothetical protein DMG65_19905 [Candidatus Angelobacter sp. Gp1-AA117]|nr:MAG: hypothetical protein DMG65_19905 [Candidatus Angelobacter sp. Gp1-AA117]
MAQEHSESFRLVIQHIHDQANGNRYYNMVAYREGRSLKASGIPLDRLLSRLGQALPGFDSGKMLMDGAETFVVFTGRFELTNHQLATLGLEENW